LELCISAIDKSLFFLSDTPLSGFLNYINTGQSAFDIRVKERFVEPTTHNRLRKQFS
jgi:hypothetical protein